MAVSFVGPFFLVLLLPSFLNSFLRVCHNSLSERKRSLSRPRDAGTWWRSLYTVFGLIGGGSTTKRHRARGGMRSEVPTASVPTDRLTHTTDAAGGRLCAAAYSAAAAADIAASEIIILHGSSHRLFRRHRRRRRKQWRRRRRPSRRSRRQSS